MPMEKNHKVTPFVRNKTPHMMINEIIWYYLLQFGVLFRSDADQTHFIENRLAVGFGRRECHLLGNITQQFQ